MTSVEGQGAIVINAISKGALSGIADKGFPIVGIGASAGGLAAFESFFSGIPVGIELNMAFILVQHLSPDHESILSNLIRHYTSMPVFDVQDGMIVKVNCIYIIQPNHDMAIVDGTLQLLDPVAPMGHRLPIDFFFRSLARDQHEKSICIILSGNGSDGTAGLRDIKAEGGMVIAQTADSSEFDGMPQSAIATDLVDFELLPSDMPAKLLTYTSQPHRRINASAMAAPKTGSVLNKILLLLRAQTGHDFSLYKTSTIYRRIERRMAVHQIESAEDYFQYIQHTPEEIEALFGDLLIGVTKFFRDPETFRMLEEKIIPKLFSGKIAHNGVIRIWCAGCSTGEEAYSLAILLYERMENVKQAYQVLIFATDIDNRAIATARAGLYPTNITSDIVPERLARFFTLEKENNMYRIHKSIRDMVIFSTQDVIKDPPFSRLDMVSCRNLMIYMSVDLQKKLIPLFHYILKPGGILFLGTSESIGEFNELFSAIDGRLKVYQRKQDFQGAQRLGINQFHTPLTEHITNSPTIARKTEAPDRLSLRETIEQALLKQISPSAALVNRQGDILYLYGGMGKFLEPVQGETGINNILKMSRDAMQRSLTTSLRKAAVTKDLVQTNNVAATTNGIEKLFNLTIKPMISDDSQDIDQSLFLIIMEELSALAMSIPRSKKHIKDAQSTQSLLNATDAAIKIATLTEELSTNREYIQVINDEQEYFNAELQSSNEEMQSVNEELQSTNEELETSKEEMQSINEELSTMNTELQTKVLELSQVSNDMNNLLASTGIGTIFVDLQLCIMRFTPAITQIINVIPSDIGRPVAHIVSNLVGYDRLVADVQSVLDSLLPKEVDVETIVHNWYTMRIRPYRTLENIIEGAVITFVDITEIIRIRTDLEKANEKLRLAAVARDANDAITVHDLDGKTICWNPGAVRQYGWSEEEALAMNVRDRIPPEIRDTEFERIHQLGFSEVLEPYQTRRLAKNGAILNVSMTATGLVNESGNIYAIATTERAKDKNPSSI